MASSEEGSFGLPVGTLRTRYPRVQASSQDNGSGSRLSAGDSSEATTCPRSSGSCPSAWGSSGAATCPCDSGSHLPARGSSGPTACHPGPSTHLLALELPRVPRMGSIGYKQLNKYPLATGHHDLHRGACTRIFQGSMRQGLPRAFARRAASGPLNADEMCGRQVTVVCHSAEWFNNSGLQCDCNLVPAPWPTCQPPLWA
jgi:hypothetical protein